MNNDYQLTDFRDRREYAFPTMADLTGNTGLTQDELIDNVITMHKNIAKALCVPVDYVRDVMVNKAGIDIVTLFTLDKHPHGYRVGNSVMYAEKAYYTEKVEKGMVKTYYYDVVVRQSEFLNDEEEGIVRIILEERMPELMLGEPFFDTVPRFNSDILIVKPSMPLEGVSSHFARYGDNPICKYTVQDLVDAMTSEHPERLMKKVSRVDIYTSCGISVYLSLGNKRERYHNSLALPLKAIMDADWSLVENYIVHDMEMVCGRFSKDLGKRKQCELECYQEPLVAELRKAFESARERISKGN